MGRGFLTMMQDFMFWQEHPELILTVCWNGSLKSDLVMAYRI